jgi:hypothetical protein
MTTPRSQACARRWLVWLAAVGASLATLAAAAPAFATGPAPWWHLDSSAAPTNIKPGDKEDKIIVTATNLGDAPVTGSKHSITISDTLPKGLKPTSVSGVTGRFQTPPLGHMTCAPVTGASTVSCTFSETLLPFELLEVTITVEVSSEVVTGEQNQATVNGGEGLPPSPPLEPKPTSLMSPGLNVTSAPTSFGIQSAALTPESEGGAVDTQAGEHPFQLTTTLHFNEVTQFNPKSTKTERSVPALAKDVQFRLPPGMIGNPKATPQCSEVDFFAAEKTHDLCKPEMAVGVAVVTLNEPFTFDVQTRAVPVFNLAPAVGEPARFGFFVLHDLVILDTSVKTGEDYGVVVTVQNASELAKVLSTEVTLWGQPGNASHDRSRGWPCAEGGLNDDGVEPCPTPEPHNLAPFLTLPTSCTGELKTTVFADSWLERGALLPDGRIDVTDPRWKEANAPSPQQEGCEKLPPFEPSIKVLPGTQAGSTPAGLTVNVEESQESLLSPSSLAESAVRDTTVALPQGMELNAGAADGLLTCSALQMGFTGTLPAEETNQTKNNKFSPTFPECPDAARVGTVKIKTPLLKNKLEGSAYLASQNTNPFEPPLVLYLVARDKESGVVVKLAGKVTPDPNTGQLVSVFEETPPLPFEDLEVSFFSGPRASVSTPPLCGTYTTATSFTPWSGASTATPSSSFQVTSGPGGSACSNPQPFTPGFEAGPTNLQAGAFTHFVVNLSRPDADQAMSTVTTHLPAGAAAMLSSITPCPEPQASQGTCGPESLIGHATALAGLGSDPITLPTGPVYITEKYKGAPFGLSIVTHAKAGPFDLGNVIVRSTINVDPNTAAVTITSDPLPLRLKGVASQIQRISVVVDRESFQFNPTNCTATKVDGVLTGAQGASASVSAPFQVTGCDKLPFHPELTAETSSETSKSDGASLRIKVTSGSGQANIGKTKVTFPLQLPTRLTTIQKACRDTVFNVNPASCPEGSVIGRAIAHTPVLKNPLMGPAYLVSHGNTAFPDAEFVLQGEGITLVLDGQTDIKKGITISTFNSVPDAPVSTFEVELPRGPHSAFGAFGSLCEPTTTVTKLKRVTLRSHGRVKHPLRRVTETVVQHLMIPTILTGQNGNVIEKQTPVKVSGCKAVKPFNKTKKATKKHSHGKKHKKH